MQLEGGWRASFPPFWPRNLSPIVYFSLQIIPESLTAQLPYSMALSRALKPGGRGGGALAHPFILQKIICFTLFTHFYRRMYYTRPFFASSNSKGFENDALANIDNQNSGHISNPRFQAPPFFKSLRCSGKQVFNRQRIHDYFTTSCALL